jgi:hypothetical protein
LVITQIASVLLVTKEEEGSILVSCEYTPKTNKIGTIPSGPAELLIALTAIYNIISLLICLSFNLS